MGTSHQGIGRAEACSRSETHTRTRWEATTPCSQLGMRETARLLAKTEGVFGGFSGGANVAAAADLLRGDHKGGVIACVICDSGLKYLSTDLWAD